jgi:hypothetical protein
LDVASVVRTTTTDGDGNHLFPLVVYGIYGLSVEHEGFRTALQRDLTLELNQNGPVDVTLELGRTSGTVQVTAKWIR